MNESIGERLRNARLKKGFTLDQVYKEIHIRPRYLEALENDQISELPSEVQGRGFLHIYGGFLDVNIQSESPTPRMMKDTIQGDMIRKNETPLTTTSDIIDTSPPIEATPGRQLQEGASLSLEQAIINSQKIFMQVGEELNQQREKLGLTLDEIERYTHVKNHYLEAIEKGQLHLLPSTVQGRGMINNYANFLELNADSLLLKFAEGLQLQREERIASERIKKHKSSQTISRLSPLRRLISTDLLVVSILILSLMGFSIWSLVQVSREREAQLEVSAPSISEILMSTEIDPMISIMTLEVTATSTQQDTNNISGIIEEIIVETPVAGIPSLDTLPLQVYIIANQRAWMRVIVDGQVSFEGRVVPGNAYPFSGTRKIELLTGNGSALRIYFNQTDLGVLGSVGEVSDRIFTIEGVLTPTPQFSPTPTATPVPTLTLMPSPTIPTATVTPYIP